MRDMGLSSRLTLANYRVMYIIVDYYGCLNSRSTTKKKNWSRVS